jgi:hypothetical protein
MTGVSILPAGKSPTAATGADGAAWSALRRELDAWAKAGRTATLWWRDDDAVAATPALRRLLGLAEQHDVPLALAVIPRDARRSLFAALAKHTHVYVLQHGYGHTNHAPAGAKKCELGADRPRAAILAELAEGRVLLQKAAGGRFLPVLVPPWNRIDAGVAAGLGKLGLAGLSCGNPRAPARARGGLVRIDAPIESIDWSGPKRRFAGAETILGAVVKHLKARRLGKAASGAPTGFLTHHLAEDAAGWRFIARFLAATARHPAVRWLDAARLFGAAA